MKQTALLSAFALLAACSGSDGVGIQVRASTATGAAQAGPDMLITDDGGAAYTVNAASLRLRHIELDLPDGQLCSDIADTLVNAECDDDGSNKIRVPGPFEVDLVAGLASPDLAGVVIPTGTYRRIDFRVEDGADDVAFAVEADFEHGGEALELSLALDFNEDIRVEQPGGVEVSSDTDLIAEFVASDWLTGVDIGACVDEGDVGRDGTRVIIDDGSTSGSCSGIEDTIKLNMKESGQLDRD